MKNTVKFFKYYLDLANDNGRLKNIFLLITKKKELTLNFLKKNARRVRNKIFKGKKKNKFFKEQLNAEAIDIKIIAKNIHVSDNEKIYCFSRPQYFYEEKNLEYCSWDLVEPVLFKNVYIIGESNFVILDKNKLIYELYFFNKKNNFSYVDPSFISENKGVFTISYNKSNEKIKKAINFCSNFSFNYYHFLFEVVAKFYYLETYCIPLEIPLVVDEIVHNTSQFKEIFDHFNKQNRDIKYIKRGNRHNVGELYYLPTINFIPPEYVDISKIKYSDCVFNSDCIKFLKNELAFKTVGNKYGKRIFISRKNASHRRKYNENEVVELFLRYGFEICYPEKLSITEQINLFSGAEFVAGVTGAAFTNLIFCREGCKALCLISHALDLSIFSTIAKIFGVDLQYFVAYDENNDANDLHAEFVLDIVKLEKTLVDFIADDFNFDDRQMAIVE